VPAKKPKLLQQLPHRAHDARLLSTYRLNFRGSQASAAGPPLTRPPRSLLDALVGEAVAASPEGTLRTGFALRIVNAFFVRAADDFVDGGRGFDVVFFEEGGDG